VNPVDARQCGHLLNPRIRRRLQQSLAVGLYLLAMLAVVLAFVPIQYPDWWPKSTVILPSVGVSWWPWVVGLSPSSHYSARIFLTLAFGLTIFLPQVETTFVSLMRQRSPIGAPYVDRKDFTCPVCSTVNRPSTQFCVKCGAQISTGTRHWGRPSQSQGTSSMLRVMLFVGLVMAFFIGLFDLTLYLALVGFLGTDSTVVLAATILSTIPSIAGYMALKEGLFRRYGSLKQFDKMVFENAFWLIFGTFFLLLATLNLMTPPPRSLGEETTLGMQLIAGLLFILHPALRRHLSLPTIGTFHY